MIIDVNTGSLNGDITGTGSNKWVAWSGAAPLTRASALPTALELTSKAEFDDEGRSFKRIDAGGSEHYVRYANNKTYQFSYWTGGTSGLAELPVQVTETNEGGQPTSVYSVKPSKSQWNSGDALPELASYTTADYVSRTEYSYSESRLASAIRSLRSFGLLGCHRAMIQQLELTGPLAEWASGWSSPDLGQVAWRLEQRWRDGVQLPTQVAWATDAATRFVGGVAGDHRQLTQLQHDVGVAEVFVARRGPTGRRSWLGEDAYRGFSRPAKNAKVPDAVIVNEFREVTRVIEFGGQYSRKRLEAFHRYWAGQLQTSYEIW